VLNIACCGGAPPYGAPPPSESRKLLRLSIQLFVFFRLVLFSPQRCRFAWPFAKKASGAIVSAGNTLLKFSPLA